MKKLRMIDCDAAAALMEPLTDLVMQAGVAILAVNRKVMTIEGKLDGSPATEADFAADRIIGDGLARLVPDVPALSEERVHLAKEKKLEVVGGIYRLKDGKVDLVG